MVVGSYSTKLPIAVGAGVGAGVGHIAIYILAKVFTNGIVKEMPSE